MEIKHDEELQNLEKSMLDHIFLYRLTKRFDQLSKGIQHTILATIQPNGDTSVIQRAQSEKNIDIPLSRKIRMMGMKNAESLSRT